MERKIKCYEVIEEKVVECAGVDKTDAVRHDCQLQWARPILYWKE